MRLQALLFPVLVLVFAAPVYASETTGTISDSAKYAWGENMGWINFAPDSGGVTITDSSVTGYAWSAIAGWINFSPTDSGGVTNTKDGILGGSAWSEGLGWLDMTGARITASGTFTGTAGVEGSSAGRVSFDCDSCDVETKWRPVSASVPPPQPSSGNGAPVASVNTSPTVVPHPASVQVSSDTTTNDPSSSGALLSALHIATVPAENSVSAFNKPLTVTPKQAGQLVQQFGPDTVVVDIPAGASEEILTITIVQNPQPADSLGGAVFIGGVVFDVIARDASGAEVHHFDKPIRITLSIPEPLQAKDIGVYWDDVTANTWTLVPGVTFTASSATILVDHLTRFAILHAPGLPQQIRASGMDTHMPQWQWGIAVLLALLLFLFLYLRMRRAVEQYRH